MFGFFTYLRQQAREAILSGVADAAAELDTVTPRDLDAFRARLAASAGAKAIAAKAEDEPEPAKAKRAK